MRASIKARITRVHKVNLRAALIMIISLKRSAEELENKSTERKRTISRSFFRKLMKNAATT